MMKERSGWAHGSGILLFSLDEVDDGQGLSHGGEPYTGEINDKTL